MAIKPTSEHTRTFAELRAWILAEAGVSNHFAFLKLGLSYADCWDEMNETEFQRGYVPSDYEKPGSPQLCEMKLLTEKEFQNWQEKFKSFHKK